MFLTSFGAKRPLDAELICEFQKKLTQNTCDTRRYQLGEWPGTYKLHDYVTGREETGAAAEDGGEEMDELLKEVSEIADKDALTAVAYFHAKFENIYPFVDGNGRTGRLAMNYFLIQHNHPPIIIHEENRRAYYEVRDSVQDLEPLRDFLRCETEKTWEKQIVRVERCWERKQSLNF